MTERTAGPVATPTRSTERRYLGGFEIYREYDGAGAETTLERETLHVHGRPATHRIGGDPHARRRRLSDPTRPATSSTTTRARRAWSWTRRAEVISYEEYYPYGSTSYQAVDARLGAAPKRYRYTGKERDEETGLAYHGARYYAPWLGRWTACDPAGLVDGPNVYSYVRQRPTIAIDVTGSTTFIVINATSRLIGDHVAIYVEPRTGPEFLYDPGGSYRQHEGRGSSQDYFERSAPDPGSPDHEISLVDYVAYQNAATPEQPGGYRLVVYAINTTDQEEAELKDSTFEADDTMGGLCAVASTGTLSALSSGRFKQIFGALDFTPVGVEANLREQVDLGDRDINRLEISGLPDRAMLSGFLESIKTFEPAEGKPTDASTEDPETEKKQVPDYPRWIPR